MSGTYWVTPGETWTVELDEDSRALRVRHDRRTAGWVKLAYRRRTMEDVWADVAALGVPLGELARADAITPYTSPDGGWVVKAVFLDYTSKAEGPVTAGCRPVGDGWQLQVRRWNMTVAYTRRPDDALALGVPAHLVTDDMRAKMKAPRLRLVA